MTSMVLNRTQINDTQDLVVTVALNTEDSVISIRDFIQDHKYYDDDPGTAATDILNQMESMTGDIRIDINSRGGMVEPGFDLYNAFLNYSKGEVTTNVIGYAFSTAGWLALAGTKRTASSNALFMCHNPVIFPKIANEADFDKIKNEWDTTRNSIATMIHERSEIPLDNVKSMMDAETFLNAEEAKEKGIFTEVASSKGDLSMLNFCPPKYLPENLKPSVSNVDIEALKERRRNDMRRRATNLRESTAKR